MFKLAFACLMFILPQFLLISSPIFTDFFIELHCVQYYHTKLNEYKYRIYHVNVIYECIEKFPNIIGTMKNLSTYGEFKYIFF